MVAAGTRDHEPGTGNGATVTVLPKRGFYAHVDNILKQLQEEAQAGRISSIVVCSKIDGEWVHDYSGCDKLHELIGALESLKWRQLMRTIPDE